MLSRKTHELVHRFRPQYAVSGLEARAPVELFRLNLPAQRYDRELNLFQVAARGFVRPDNARDNLFMDGRWTKLRDKSNFEP